MSFKNERSQQVFRNLTELEDSVLFLNSEGL